MHSSEVMILKWNRVASRLQYLSRSAALTCCHPSEPQADSLQPAARKITTVKHSLSIDVGYTLHTHIPTHTHTQLHTPPHGHIQLHTPTHTHNYTHTHPIHTATHTPTQTHTTTHTHTNTYTQLHTQSCFKDCFHHQHFEPFVTLCLCGLILKLKRQYSEHLMQMANSLEKTLLLGKIEGKRRKRWQRMRWLDGITD